MTSWTRPSLALIAFALVVSANGQFRLELPKEPVPKPVTQPLPRRFVGVHPVTIYSGLMSKSAEDRKRALQYLGIEGADASDPIEASVRSVHLDAHPGLQFILVLKGTPPASIAYVFDQDDRGWWEIGKFTYWWHWNAEDAERFFELREIVQSDQKYILVRDMEGGSGLQQTDLAIYRMYNGALYRIFQTREDSEGWVVGTSRTEFEHRDISFPEANSGDPVFLVSRDQKWANIAGRSPRPSESCTAYRWDAVAFLFVEDKAASPKICTTHAGH